MSSYKDRLEERRRAAQGDTPARLTVIATPADAEIELMIAGKRHLLTPGVEAALPIGEARIRLFKDGYVDAERTVTLEADPIKLEVTLVEKPVEKPAESPKGENAHTPIVVESKRRTKQGVDIRVSDDDALDELEAFVKRHREQLGSRKKGLSLISRAGWHLLHEMIKADPDRALAFLKRAV